MEELDREKRFWDMGLMTTGGRFPDLRNKETRKCPLRGRHPGLMDLMTAAEYMQEDSQLVDGTG